MAPDTRNSPPLRAAAPKFPSWRDQLRNALRDPQRICQRLGLDPSLAQADGPLAQGFGTLVPEAFLQRIRPGDPRDPLLLQVLPSPAEDAPPGPGDLLDPVGDLAASRHPGLLQKYRGRALLITSGACAVACRYCFRRHFPYAEQQAGRQEIPAILAEIQANPDIEEIILSGGDPLMRSDAWLAALVTGLETLPQLRRLRVHSRLPIVLPDRVTPEFCSWLGGSRLAPSLVVHCNHPQELDKACGHALLRVVRAGIPVLNQAVLLRGINDNADTLTRLSQRLLDLRVLPYYLHQLDPVQGAAHFRVPVRQGLELLARMRERLPGLGVPRYVAEVPGAAHKVELGPEDAGAR